MSAWVVVWVLSGGLRSCVSFAWWLVFAGGYVCGVDLLVSFRY